MNRLGDESGAGCEAPTEGDHAHDEGGGASDECTTLPFGPYHGREVDEVSVIDAGYLLGLVREGVGPAALRASAAGALARRGALPTVDAHGGSTMPRALIDRPLLWAVALTASLVLGVVMVSDLRSGLQRGNTGGAASTESDRQLFGAPEGRAPTTVSDPNLLGATEGRAPGGVRDPIPGSSGESKVLPSQDPASPVVSGAHVDPVHPCGARLDGAIPASSAADFEGTFQAVEFRVVRTKDTGRVTFLNSRDPYQGHFYVAIFPGDYHKFADAPAQHFDGRCIVVQGPIELYRGAPQIVLRSPDDVRVLSD